MRHSDDAVITEFSCSARTAAVGPVPANRLDVQGEDRSAYFVFDQNEQLVCERIYFRPADDGAPAARRVESQVGRWRGVTLLRAFARLREALARAEDVIPA